MDETIGEGGTVTGAACIVPGRSSPFRQVQLFLGFALWMGSKRGPWWDVLWRCGAGRLLNQGLSPLLLCFVSLGSARDHE